MTEAIRSFAKAQAKNPMPLWLRGILNPSHPSHPLDPLHLAGLKSMSAPFKPMDAYDAHVAHIGSMLHAGIVGASAAAAASMSTHLHGEEAAEEISAVVRTPCSLPNAELPQVPPRAVSDMTADELHVVIVSAVKQGLAEAQDAVSTDRYKRAFQ